LSNIKDNFIKCAGLVCHFIHTSDVEFYGFEHWLREFTAKQLAERSGRRASHGWYHYNPEIDLKLVNTLASAGCGWLVQDVAWQRALQDRGIEAFATGLPFTSFYFFAGGYGLFSNSRKGKLFIPTHSAPGGNHRDAIVTQVEEFARSHEDFAVLLSVYDIDLAPQLSRYTSRFEVGAGVYELYSFYRLVRIFESYEEIHTNTYGSHIIYASLCGARVIIHKFVEFDNLIDKYASEQGLVADPNRAAHNSFNYFKSNFGLIDEDTNVFTVKYLPKLISTDPFVLSNLLFR
jgi:hypothetical protein